MLSGKLARLTLMATVAAITLGIAAGSAAASPGESLTTTLTGPLPQSPPFFGTASGTYTASGEFSDQGSIVAQFLLPGQPPNSTQIVSDRTLVSDEGNGTLQLECSEVSRPASPLATKGPCAVLSATGPYAKLARRGELTGVIVPPDTVTDTIVF